MKVGTAWILALGLMVFCRSAIATEPPCAYPDCFPGNDLSGKRVFKDASHRLEVFTLGRLGPATLTLYRLYLPAVKAASFVEAYVVQTDDQKAYKFRQYHPVSYPEMRLPAELDKADSVTIITAAGATPFTLAYDAKATRALPLRTIQKAYEQEVASAEFQLRLVEAEQRLQGSLQALSNACGTGITAWLDGKSVKTAQMNVIDSTDMPYRCLDVVQAVQTFCERGTDEANAVRQSIKSIGCVFHTGGKSTASLDKKSKELRVRVSMTQDRDGARSFDAIGFVEKKVMRPRE